MSMTLEDFSLQDARAKVGLDRVATALYRRGLDGSVVVPAALVETLAPELVDAVRRWQADRSTAGLLLFSRLDTEALLGADFDDIPVWCVSAPDMSADTLAQVAAPQAFRLVGVHYPDLYHRKAMVELGTDEYPMAALIQPSDLSAEAGVLLIAYASLAGWAFAVIPIDEAEVAGWQGLFSGVGVNYNPFAIWTPEDLEKSRVNAHPDRGARELHLIPVSVSTT